MKDPVAIVTHSDKFHADDIFACAIAELWLEKEKKAYTVTRTRDPKIIENADIVFDVGGVYDPSINRFDHHQKGGAGARENGILYAGCGLVWKAYGEMLAESSDIARILDEKLIQPIDADDNGMDLVEQNGAVSPYFLQDFLYAYRPTWKEDHTMYDEMFISLVELAKRHILREIKVISDAQEARRFIEEAYMNAEDKRLIIFDRLYPFEQVLPNFPEPLFVVAPRANGSWKVETVRKTVFGFENRKDLPKEWAGLRDSELANISGVDDAIFCHNGLFLVVANSRQGALELAQIALNK